MLRPIIIGAASLLTSAAAVAGTGSGGPQSENQPPAPTDGVLVMFSGPGVGQAQCPADVNEDGQVDVDDLIMVILAYGNTGDLPVDINEDGAVDFLDLLEVIADWGPCPV